MSKLTRRTFLKATAAASTAFPLFTIAGTKASGRVIGANDTIRIGVAGINSRGTAHIGGFAPQENVDVTYLIDPDTRLFESRSKQVEAKGGNRPTCVQDIRKALDDSNLDAVSVATCNHWHSLITIWACQAGKDVYVEKPISHNVFEGRKCVEAAKKYNRIVMHGTQQRSSQGRANEMAAIQSGNYGKLLVSKGYCCKPRWSIGFKDVENTPAELDFNIWLGPSKLQPFHRNLVHYNWHWFWETGNGDIGNQGVHEIDVARWAIKDGTLPKGVWSLGGRFIPGEEGLQDQGQTPNMQMSVYDYGDVILLFEVRGLVGKEGVPNNVSNEFYTSEGMIRGGKFYPKSGGDAVSIKGEGRKLAGGGDPFAAFTTAMRSRRPEDNNADAETAHLSAALCHLGNISYRLGTTAAFDKQAKSLGDNKQVVESFENIRENLKAVDVQLDGREYTVGRELAFDPVKEQFLGDDEANALLTRNYRKPFVVPDEV
jgi:predicted dehydrogenase